MSSQVNASGKKSKITSLYFKLPKTTYEKFVNKKWVERKDYFELKQKFILRTAAEWKDMQKASREQFLNAPNPQANHMSIINFSPSITVRNKPNLTSEETSQTVPPGNEGTQNSSTPLDSNTPLDSSTPLDRKFSWHSSRRNNFYIRKRLC